MLEIAKHVLTHQPTHDWIVARKIPISTDTAPIIHGVVRPNQSPPHHYAVVIATGPGRANVQTGFTPALPCAVGNCVMVRAMAGDPETVDGIEYHWFIPDEIMAVVPVPTEASSLVAA